MPAEDAIVLSVWLDNAAVSPRLDMRLSIDFQRRSAMTQKADVIETKAVFVFSLPRAAMAEENWKMATLRLQVGGKEIAIRKVGDLQQDSETAFSVQIEAARPADFGDLLQDREIDRNPDRLKDTLVRFAEQVFVYGKVSDAKQQPLRDVFAFVYAVEIGSETLLGKAQTESGGTYEIEVPLEAKKDIEALNLIVKIRLKENQNAKVIARSDLFPVSKDEQEINIRVADDAAKTPSLFAQLDAFMARFQDAGKDKELSKDEIAVLAHQSGLPKQSLSWYAQARAVARALEIELDSRAVEIMFAALLMERSADPMTVLRQPLSTFRAHYQQALSQNAVGPTPSKAEWERFDKVVESYQQQALQADDPAGVQLLRLIGVPEGKLAAIAVLLVETGVSRDDLVDSLRGILGQSPLISKILELREMHLALFGKTELLLALMQRSFGWLPGGKLTKPRDLAGLRVSELRGDHATQDQAQTHVRFLGLAYPGAQIGFAFLRSTRAADKELGQLILDNPKLDMGGEPASRTHGVTNNEDDAKTLEQVQSLFKSTPAFARRTDIVVSLQKANVFNAAMIVAKGKPWLRTRFDGWGYTMAAADHTFQGASTLLASIYVQQSEAVIDRSKVDPTNSHGVIAALFSGTMHADCPHCRSELSPSAYLLDLLRFCGRAHSNPKQTLNVLRSRRPDIEQIGLTCANTDTVLPHIDLSLEILEYAARPLRKKRDTSGSTAERLARPQYTDKRVYNDLRDRLFPWEAPFDLSEVEWAAHMDHLEVAHDAAWLLRKGPGAAFSQDEAIARDLGWSPKVVGTLASIQGLEQIAPAWGLLQGESFAGQLDTVQRVASWVGLPSQMVYDLIVTEFVRGGSAAADLVDNTGVFAKPDELPHGFYYRLQMIGRMAIRTGLAAEQLDRALAGVEGATPPARAVMERLADLSALGVALDGDFDDALDAFENANNLPYLADMVGEDSDVFVVFVKASTIDIADLSGLRAVFEVYRDVEDSSFTLEEAVSLVAPVSQGTLYSREDAETAIAGILTTLSELAPGETPQDTDILRATAVVEALASALGLSIESAKRLGNNFSILQQQLLDAQGTEPVEILTRTYLILQKQAAFVTLTGVTDSKFDLLFHSTEDFSGVDVRHLPVTDQQAAGKPQNLIALDRQIQSAWRIYDGGLGDVFKDIFNNGHAVGLKNACELAGVDAQRVKALLTFLKVEISDTEFLYSYEIIPWLAEVVTWQQELGASINDLKGIFCNREMDVLDELRSQSEGESQWLDMLRDINDVVRKAKRDVLVRDRLNARRQSAEMTEMPTEFDLYDYYLIDPETEPCFETARIKQATSSVQQFIQRIILGLEPGLALDAQAVLEWQWRKNFRVWEANRKVFLYPENWLEPSLRDDKSDLFVDLEDELLQDEVNADTAQQAMVGYLKGLHALGNLQVIAALSGDEYTSDRVFARSRDLPHQHFMMEKTPNGIWSGWKLVDVDIDNASLVPVMYNRQLYLFWPTYQDNGAPIPTSGGSWLNRDLTMNWTVQNPDGTWEPKKQSQLIVKVRDSWMNTFNVDVSDGINLHLRMDIVNQDPDPDTQTIRVLKFDPALEEFTSYSTTSSIYNKSRLQYAASSAQGTGLSWWCYDVTMLASGRLGAHTILADKGDVYSKLVFPMSRYMEDFRKFFLYQAAQQTYLVEVSTSTNVIASHDAEHFGLDSLIYSDPYTVESEVDISAQDNVGSDGYDAHYLPADQSSSAGGGSGNRPSGMGSNGGVLNGQPSYTFVPFFHPYSYDYLSHVVRHGLDGFFKPDSDGPDPIANWMERQRVMDTTTFNETYQPTTTVNNPNLPLVIEFDRTRPFATYNWEVFFHAPLMIAERLSANRRFSEAQRWFHFIFDPTDQSDTRAIRFWRFRPFALQLRRLLGEELNDNGPLVFETSASHAAQLEEWEDNPFNPHAVARLRTLAYMRATVLAYLDNLINWADDLFRQDTMESVNEAAQLYVLASQLLGQRPAETPVIEDPDRSRTADQLMKGDSGEWDWSIALAADTSSGAGETERQNGVLDLFAGNGYFCNSANDRISDYWATVEDRMFKLRNCQNIEGVVRKLPLYQPPIDPGMLVAAAAAGLSISDALSAANAPRPPYRFVYMLQRAHDFTNDVKALAGMILSALEKKDAEALALLRSEHEIEMSEQVLNIRKEQVDEAEAQIETLNVTLSGAENRHAYYDDLLTVGDLPGEKREQKQLKKAHKNERRAGHMEMLASIVGLFPQVGTSNHFGGIHLAGVARAVAGHFSTRAIKFNYQAGKAARKAGRTRRNQGWRFERTSAKDDIKRIKRDILAAEIRKAMAENEVRNQENAIDRANEAYDYLSDKFTNAELYDWMAGRLKTLHYQAYQMASDLARRAEACMRAELGISSNIIQYGHYESGKNGLLAGEALSVELRRLEEFYLSANERKPELTKNVSLARLDPEQLVKLRYGEEAKCEFTLPEFIYDLDHPGHYKRRIKSVSLTIPALAGPQTTIGCTLSLLGSVVRDDARLDEAEDTFSDPKITGSIHTSGGQNDSGVFQLQFKDERYLPFEGAGAVSQWRLQLPRRDIAQFDYGSITDVIIQVSYTAEAGSSQFRDDVEDAWAEALAQIPNAFEEEAQPLRQLLSLRYDFALAWAHLLQDSTATTVELDISKERFPYLFANRSISLKRLDFSEPTATGAGVEDHVTLTGQDAGVITVTLPQDVLDAVRAGARDMAVLVEYEVGEAGS